MTTDLTRAREALEQAKVMLGDCELNMSNFVIAGDHPGSVEYLNNCAISAYGIIDEALTQLSQPEQREGDAVAIPRAVYAFLMGNGDLDGYFFGDDNPNEPGRFWWRRRMRMGDASPPLPKDREQEAGVTEQVAFVQWAGKNNYDLETHPLHWLFLNERTYAARQGWKAALEFAAPTSPPEPAPALSSERYAAAVLAELAEAKREISTLRDVVVTYGDRLRMGTVHDMAMQQAIDRAFDRED